MVRGDIRVISWHNALAYHQTDTWRTLQGLLGRPVRFIVADPKLQARRRQGWEVSDVADLDVTVLAPSVRGLLQGISIIMREPRDAIHFFGGFWTVRRFFLFCLAALATGRRVLVANEGYPTTAIAYFDDSRGLSLQLRARARVLAYRFARHLTRLAAGPEAIAVLAISHAAERQFLAAGFHAGQVWPFAYFVSPRRVASQRRPGEGGTIRLVFVGTLLRRKGIDLLLRAVEAARHRGARIALDVYGPGKLDRFMSGDLPSVCYRGIIPFGEAQEVISQYDSLVLPSRHDGWGVVVNEALLQGVPVIASDRVGAAAVVSAFGAGAVFPSDDLPSLVDLLVRLDHDLLRQWQQNALRAGRHLLPEVGAQYLLDVIQHQFFCTLRRPHVPWVQQPDGHDVQVRGPSRSPKLSS